MSVERDNPDNPSADPSHPSSSAGLSRSDIHGPGPRARWRRPAAAVVAGILVIGAGVGGWVTSRLNGNITKVDVSAAIGTNRPTPPPTKAVNMLLIGSDTREGEGNDTYGRMLQDPGNHSDTNLIVHLSADRTRATVVSIPRDSMTPAPPKCSPTAPME